MAKNSDCIISDSTLCKWMGKDCSDCQILRLKSEEEVKKALSDFEVTLSLLPEDIDELQGDECQFCKDHPGKRARYALVDLANTEPKSQTGMFFGLGKKVTRRVGSLMPMSISICRDCRKAFLFTDLIKWIASIGLLAIAIAVLAIPGVGSSLNQEISLLIAAAAAVIGYFAGRVISAAYIKAKSASVRFSIFEIPIVAKMRDLGWFTLLDDNGVTKLLFSRKSRTHSVKELRAKEAQQPEG